MRPVVEKEERSYVSCCESVRGPILQIGNTSSRINSLEVQEIL